MWIVQKYGGTSVGTIERMRSIAARCLDEGFGLSHRPSERPGM